MSAPPSRPSRPVDTFEALVEGVIVHPLFPVVIKKIFDICNTDAFEHSYLIPHFTENENKALQLQSIAAEEGLDVICDKVSPTDVFMSTMVVALNDVRAIDFQDPCRDDLLALRSTISVGQRALGSTTDPRFVGATEKCHAEGQRTGPGFPHGGIQRSEILRPVGSAIQRVGSTTQHRKQQKPVTKMRQPLSDKAKKMLERWFQEHLQHPYPSVKEKEELAALCELNMSSLNNWFGNKRMRIKRKVLQAEGAGDNRAQDSVLAPQSKWNAVVLSKMTSPAGREVLVNATGRDLPPSRSVEIDRKGKSGQKK